MNINSNMNGEDPMNIISSLEEIFPGIIEASLKKLQKKNNENNILLQEEQNLAEDINLKKDVLGKIRLEICDLQAKYHDVEESIKDLEAKRTEIHKKWIALNPQPQVKKLNSPSKPDLHLIFDLLANMFDDYGHTSYREYKRFDNLANGRSRTCCIFGREMDIVSVVAALDRCGRSDLANELIAFYESKV